MKLTVDMPLFLVEVRPSRVEPARELSPLDQYLGWIDRTAGEPLRQHGAPVVLNEGDQHGLIHKLTSPALLTLHPCPGHRVLGTWTIRATYHPRRGIPGLGRPVSMCVVDVPTGPHGRWVLQATTHLGRPVMLGEDSAEEAYGHDAVQKFLDGWLEDGDERPIPCGFEVVENQ